ncbi:uncharacterized protein [Zea mays]|uniref:Uncharacterized protein n=1 Tax=Zea mays TaxID=4577 RepID=A0A804MGP1_MAIZE|nr:uncharacterized protein LOC111590871 [Zea mays]|eukprot:XP_023157546.1 uncharacterized protein LOC111590871 [Zea mays]
MPSSSGSSPMASFPPPLLPPASSALPPSLAVHGEQQTPTMVLDASPLQARLQQGAVFSSAQELQGRPALLPHPHGATHQLPVHGCSSSSPWPDASARPAAFAPLFPCSFSPMQQHMSSPPPSSSLSRPGNTRSRALSLVGWSSDSPAISSPTPLRDGTQQPRHLPCFVSLPPLRACQVFGKMSRETCGCSTVDAHRLVAVLRSPQSRRRNSC